MSRMVVIGDINLDVLARVPSSLPEDGEVRTSIHAEAGGSAANLARVAASHGAVVEFIGCVGDDLVGDLLIESLNRSGVIPHVQRFPAASGTIVSLKRDGGKTILCSRGANDMIDPSFIDEKWFDGADHLHLSGYAFLSKSQRIAARRAIVIAESREMTISIDPPPANLIVSFGVEQFLDEISAARIILPNLEEGRVMTGRGTPEEIVDTLSSSFPIGALTMGRGGSIAWNGQKRFFHHTEEIGNVDPTGAGDSFAAGFIVSYLRDRDVDQANREGTTAAREHLLKRVRHTL